MNTITFDIKFALPLERWKQAVKLGITEEDLPALVSDLISDQIYLMGAQQQEEAIVKDNTAILTLNIEIPKHYYEFFEHIRKVYGLGKNYLAKAAADGIVMDINERQGMFGEAVIKPVLTVGSKSFRAAEAQPV